MEVTCQVCESKGRVPDEARERAVLWVCGQCETRYLVSSSAMRKAPVPPPARNRIRHTTDESQVLFSSEQVAALRELAGRRQRATPPPMPALASVVAEAVAPPAPPVEVLATYPPVQSLYSVTAIPVRDPLWRRPALFGGALAGLLVGLAAWGVGWGREHILQHMPAIAAVFVEQPEGASPTSAVAREPGPTPLGTPVFLPEMEIAVTPEVVASEAPPSEPAATRAARAGMAARTSAGAAPARSMKRATRAPDMTEPETPYDDPAETTAATLVAVPALSPIPPAGAPPLEDAIAAAAAKEAPAPPLVDAPASQSSDSAAGPFSRDAALAALTGAASTAARCRSPEGPFGAARIAVTFSPAGTVTTATVEGPPFAGTPVGSCIALAFRGARVSPFTGGPVTVHKNVSIF